MPLERKMVTGAPATRTAPSLARTVQALRMIRSGRPPRSTTAGGSVIAGPSSGIGSRSPRDGRAWLGEGGL